MGLVFDFLLPFTRVEVTDGILGDDSIHKYNLLININANEFDGIVTQLDPDIYKTQSFPTDIYMI